MSPDLDPVFHGDPPRALVVEDSRAWQEILGEILTDMGLVVDVAGDVDAAVAGLRAAPHRLAVVDLSLREGERPDQDGLQVLEAVRRYDPGCVPVLLTGFATVELAVSALSQYGAFSCLRKEMFRRAEFKELVRRVLAVPPPAEAASEGPVVPPATGEPAPGGTPAVEEAVLLVEDDAGWRSVLAELLAEAGYGVRACASYGEALGHLRRGRYVLAVVDLSLASSRALGANRDGVQVLIGARSAGIPAIVVSGQATLREVEGAYAEHGIFAYLEKQAFDRAAFRATVAEAVAAGRAGDVIGRLTPREREVLVLLVGGMTNKGIASAMVISTNTVKRYLKSIFEKLDVDSRAAAVARAVSAGARPAERG